MKIHQFSIDEALASLHSRHEGLTTIEVECRFKEYGSNQIDEAQQVSLLWRFVK